MSGGLVMKAISLRLPPQCVQCRASTLNTRRINADQRRWCSIQPPQEAHKPPFSSDTPVGAEVLGMNSRVHPKYKTRYGVTNWAEYDQASP